MEQKEGTIYTVIVYAKYVEDSIRREKISDDVRSWLKKKGYDVTSEDGRSEIFSLSEDIRVRYVIFGRGIGMDKSLYEEGQRCVVVRIRYKADGKYKCVFYNHKPYLKHFESRYFKDGKNRVA